MVLVFIFLGTNLVWAQEYNDFLLGKLMNAKTGEPIVFATIRVKGKALGVISNKDGGFKIPTAFQFKGDALVISSMGYQTIVLDFTSLREKVVNRILMEPFTFELDETIVTANKARPLSARKIVKRAIDRIADNYDRNPFELVGYYRDYQLRKDAYINLNEALVRVYDKGFGVEDYSGLQFGLYNYRNNLDFEVDTVASNPYDYQKRIKFIPDVVFNNTIVPNELVLLFNHDAIRHNSVLSYSYVDVFSEDFIRQHDFLTYYLTNYDDKKVYKIRFIKELRETDVRGAIYIDTDTYAIRQLDYAVYRNKTEGTSHSDLQASTSDLAYYDEASAIVRDRNAESELLYEVRVAYQEQSNMMYLNYISFYNKFKLVRPPEFYLKEVVVNSDTRQVDLVLNKPAKNWRSLRSPDLRIHYRQTRLKVEKLSQVNYRTYRMMFSAANQTQRERLDQLFSDPDSLYQGSINVEIKNLKDFEGNLLGEQHSELLDQFREFFTQKVVKSNNKRSDKDTMVDKRISLGNNEQQKIETPDDTLWMNTPLKSTEQH